MRKNSVKNQMDSNIFEFNAASTMAHYADFIDGDTNSIALVLSTSDLVPEAKRALALSCAQLGYGADACCWATIVRENGSAAEATPKALAAFDVRQIVEGMDPAAIIAADATTVALLGEAYACDIPLDAHTRILGREVTAFADFAGMLGEEREKQRAWALLKKMSRSHA